MKSNVTVAKREVIDMQGSTEVEVICVRENEHKLNNGVTQQYSPMEMIS